ncbi:MAG: hypothetical protein J6330_07920, partial [Clostridia bacterium]|nr:hypothetical protein [Clostridia bacterium]
MKKILCVILAVVLLSCAAACTGNETQTDTGTEGTTETVTDTETVTEPEVTVPEYEDVGLTAYLHGVDERKTFEYDFSKYKYSALRADSNLVFTSNEDYKVD